MQVPDCLQFSGVFGHRFTVVKMIGGAQHLHGQTNSLEMAQRWVSEETKVSAHIWERVKRDPFLIDWRRGWKFVE